MIHRGSANAFHVNPNVHPGEPEEAGELLRHELLADIVVGSAYDLHLSI